jgi:predicted nucleic acid-binding protein
VVNRVSGDLLDTSILIAPDPAALADLPGSAAISVITLGELHASVLLARDKTVEEARRARLVAVKASFAPLLVDEAVAEHYGKVLAVARTERRTVKATDLLIIATAAAHARTLHTLDERQASLARAAGIAVEIL